MRALARVQPLVLIANHSTWWDGLVLSMLTEGVLGLDGYVLMDANNLRRMRFFALCGAFGIDTRSLRDGVAGLRYATSLLDRPGRAVWLFPQGREQPSHVRLSFQPGAARLASLGPVAEVVPVGLGYVFGSEELPQLWAAFGAPLHRGASWRSDVETQQEAVAEVLATIDAALAAPVEEPADGFRVLWEAPRRRDWLTWGLDRMVAPLLRTERAELGEGNRRRSDV